MIGKRWEMIAHGFLFNSFNEVRQVKVIDGNSILIFLKVFHIKK